ncbi:MAG: FAD-dependent oxidoreductase [Lachnospiraceae bacterium]|nr:FAD-dependent oxidoreductase [Lachnospiraceae bacterium]
MKNTFDAIVIGGGTTGTGVIRDLALRGFTNSLLLERDDLGAGTSGGCHSALHGGSRYVYSDIQTARECLQENQTYRKIVPQVVDPTSAIWVAKTEEQIEFSKIWMKRADEIGLPYEIISVEEARECEPVLSEDIKFALRTIDTGFDPFRLCIAQAYDAKIHGAEIRTHHEVIGALMDGNRVVGLRVLDKEENNIYEVYADLVINASGPWCSQITEMAGFAIPMKPNKGSTGIYSMRPTTTLIGILRVPADGDGLVSQGFQNTALLGTSSVDVDDPDQAEPGMDEIKIMEDSVAEIIPELREARMIRMCTGVRPLYTTGKETGRDISRGMYLLDHAEMEGIEGIITITGGKYATARLMAEETVNLASKKLCGEVRPCTTGEQFIYGATTKEEAEKEAQEIHEKYHISRYAAHKFTARYGEFAKKILERYPDEAYIIDDAVQMIGSEVCYSFEEENVKNFCDLRRRTRIGMGQEQGTFSIYKAGAIAQESLGKTVDEAEACILGYAKERWKGVYFSNQYGDQLPLTEVMQQVYVGLAGYDVFAD